MGSQLSGTRHAPRASAFRITRERLIAWLVRHCATPVRLVAAPPGFGKSMILQEYVAGRDRTLYVHAPSFESIDAMVACVREAVERWGDSAVVEVAIDDADALTESESAVLEDLLRDAPAGVRFILGSRSRAIIRDPHLMLDGTVDVLGLEALSMKIGEIATLCDGFGVAYSDADLVALLKMTDGWPMLVHETIRYAAGQKQSLSAAFSKWMERHAGDLSRTIAADLDGHPLAAAFQRLCEGKSADNIDDLDSLERHGLYVKLTGGRYEVLRPISDLFATRAQTRESPSSNTLPMHAHLLGEFKVHIGGRRVEWLRRKDAQLFRYLLMRPTGAASRAELCDVFWPEHDSAQARQNLRTTCSNIRSALRACLPFTDVSQYFSSRGTDLCVALDTVVTDLSRFNNQVALGKEALANNDTALAAVQFGMAHRTYRGPLMVDPPGCFYADIAEEIEEKLRECNRAIAQFSASRPAPEPSAESVRTA
jgi:hypothetical protein